MIELRRLGIPERGTAAAVAVSKVLIAVRDHSCRGELNTEPGRRPARA